MENKNLKKKTQIKDNSNEILNDIFIRLNNKNTLSRVNQNNILDNFLNILENSESEDIVYILSQKLNLIKSQRYINSAIRRGVKIYIIVENGALLEEYFGDILIRESSNLPEISLILKEKDKKVTGFLSQGNITEDNYSYILNVDYNQGIDLKKYFVNTFWNKSEYEYRKNIKLVAKSLYENYNYDEIIENNYNVNEILNNFIEKNENIYSYYFNSLDYSDLKNSSLQLEKKDLNEFEYIESLGQYNKIFINAENNLNSFLFTDEDGYYISDFENSKNTFIMNLNQEQIRNLKNYENILKSTADYIYCPQIAVGEINKDFFFLKDTNKNITVKERSIKKLKPVKTETIEDYLYYDLDKHINSSMFFDEKDIALEYEYTLEVYPPYLPKGAIPARLIKEWESFNKNLKNFLNREIETLTKSIQKINSNSLFRNLIGGSKLNKFESSLKSLNELKSLNFLSLEENELKEKLKEIDKINKNSNLNSNEINNEIEENEKHEIKQMEKDISELQEVLSQIDKEIKELEIPKEYESKSKKNKKKNNKNNKNKLLEDKQMEYKNLLKTIEKNEKILKDKKTRLENNNIFINSEFKIEAPSERKNTIGNLYEYNECRYLAIKNQKELEEALEEAKRLNAKVVFE